MTSSPKDTRETRQQDAQAILDGVRILVSQIRGYSHAVESRQGKGITGAQLFVMQQLLEGGALSINEIAARTRTHQSSVSVVVARLKAAGLVAARPSKEDRRRLSVVLTAKGTRVARSEQEPLQLKLFAALDRLPAALHVQLAVGMRAWLKEAGLLRQVAPMFFEEPRRPEDDSAGAVKPAGRRRTPRQGSKSP